MEEHKFEKPSEREKSVFTDFETIALVMHIETAKISDLKDALDSIQGLKIIYQRKKENGKLYITDEDPREEEYDG